MSLEGRRAIRPIFRRRRFAARRKRPSVWPLLLRGFFSALLLVAMPAAAAIWVTTAPRFELREVRIVPTPHVPTAWVETVIGPFDGYNLLLLSLNDIGGRMQGHPWIERVELRKELPSALEVRVVERRPHALLRQQDGLYLIDDRGSVIAPFEPEAVWADLLLVTLEEDSTDAAEALAVVSRLARIHPAWNQGLSEIEALGAGDYRLYNAVYPFPVVVSADALRRQISKLMQWWPRLSPRVGTPAMVDLRFAKQMIIKTAAEPRG